MGLLNKALSDDSFVFVVPGGDGEEDLLKNKKPAPKTTARIIKPKGIIFFISYLIELFWLNVKIKGYFAPRNVVNPEFCRGDACSSDSAFEASSAKEAALAKAGRLWLRFC